MQGRFASCQVDPLDASEKLRHAPRIPM
jgi:hypothetical protein